MKSIAPSRIPPAPRSLARTIASLPWAAPLALFAPCVFAQQEAAVLPPVTVTAAQPTRLDRPASTASNLELTPLQTPASAETITREQLESRGDASLINAITRATGISTLGHPGNSGSSLSVRGFTDTVSVMRLYDGMRQYGGVGVSFPFDTWSIDRIEVLRGPASVIHGDGAIGGVINIVPKKPTRGPVRNEVQVQLGTEGERALAFGSGGGINELLSYRLDLSGRESDGWVDRGENSQLTFSGAVRLDVSPEFHLSLSHSQGRHDPMRYFGSPLIDGQPLRALRDKNYNVADSAMKFEDRWTELDAQWTPGSRVTVRSKLYHIVSDRHWRNAETYTYNAGTGLIDRSGNTEIRHEQEQTGNTTHATFSGRLLGLPNQVAAGFDVNRSSFRHTNNTYTGSSPSVDPFNPDPGLFVSAAPFVPRYRNEADQHSVFAEDRLEITPQWSVVGGLRHDRADVSRFDLVAGTPAFDRSFSHTGWRLGAVYLLRPATSVYAQFSKAADPVASMLFLSPANSVFDLAKGRQVELGIKQSFWGGKGDWTLAAYAIEKNNLLTRDTTNPALRVQVGQRSSRGVEGTLSLPLGASVQLDANVAVLRARFDDFTESVGGVAVSRNGNVPPDVPQRLANLWLGWRFQPGWSVSGGLRHVGKRYADNANTLVLPAYTLVDAALQWQAAPSTTVALRAFNMFDRYHFTTSYYTTSQWFVGEGRRVQLSVNHRF